MQITNFKIGDIIKITTKNPKSFIWIAILGRKSYRGENRIEDYIMFCVKKTGYDYKNCYLVPGDCSLLSEASLFNLVWELNNKEFYGNVR